MNGRFNSGTQQQVRPSVKDSEGIQAGLGLSRSPRTAHVLPLAPMIAPFDSGVQKNSRQSVNLSIITKVLSRALHFHLTALVWYLARTTRQPVCGMLLLVLQSAPHLRGGKPPLTMSHSPFMAHFSFGAQKTS